MRSTSVSSCRGNRSRGQQNPVALHAAGEGGVQGLLGLGLGVGGHLALVPFLGRQDLALVILEDGVVLGAEEEDDGVAMLQLAARDGLHAMHARVELLAREEAEHVADVDDGVPRPRLHVVPPARQQHLEPPLLAEEERQAARVGVLVQAESFRVGVLLGVPQQAQERFGRLLFSMQFFEPSARLQAQSVRQVFQHRGDDDMRHGNKSLE